MTKLLKPAAVAEVLDLTDREVRQLCAEGKIKAGKVGRHWRVHPEDLEAFIRELRGITDNVVPMKKQATT